MPDAHSGQDWRAWFAENGARLRLIAVDGLQPGQAILIDQRQFLSHVPFGFPHHTPTSPLRPSPP